MSTWNGERAGDNTKHKDGQNNFKEIVLSILVFCVISIIYIILYVYRIVQLELDTRLNCLSTM